MNSVTDSIAPLAKKMFSVTNLIALGLADRATAPSKLLHKAVRITNEVLRAALQEDRKFTDQAYLDFVVQACSGGAAAGHATVRCFQRDGGRSYEDQFSFMQLEQGATVSLRMEAPCFSWGVQKSTCHKLEYSEEFQHTQEKLQIAMAEAEPLPKHRIWQLRSCLSSWPAKAGLGVDLWVLKLWANLPEAFLRVLLLILYFMEDGCLPMQALMVLIGLLPKPKGGSDL